MYMLPPIYQCQTGHCVCSDCIKTTKKCPTCQASFNSTQNFALAQIIQHMVYPCVYKECSYSCKPKDIRKHEASCVYQPELCPVEVSTQCQVEPIRSKIREHLMVDHSDLLLLTDEICCNLDDDDATLTVTNYIIPYGEKVFVLQVEYDIDRFSWSMQLVNSDLGDKNFRFAIDVQDKSGGNRRIYLSGNCTSLDEGFDDDSSIYLTIEQLEPFQKDSKAFYKVRILEEN